MKDRKFGKTNGHSSKNGPSHEPATERRQLETLREEEGGGTTKNGINGNHLEVEANGNESWGRCSELKEKSLWFLSYYTFCRYNIPNIIVILAYTPLEVMSNSLPCFIVYTDINQGRERSSLNSSWIQFKLVPFPISSSGFYKNTWLVIIHRLLFWILLQPAVY